MAKTKKSNTRKLNIKTKRPITSKKKKNAANPQTRELWAIVFFLISAFIFICNQLPKTTGFIGYWAVQVFGRKLVGDAVLYLPIFLIIPAITLLISKTKLVSVISNTIALFFSFTVCLEINAGYIPQMLSWPLAVSKGGVIGLVGAFLLNKCVGYYGSWIFIVGAIAISCIIIFNFSLKKIITQTLKTLSQILATILKNKKQSKLSNNNRLIKTNPKHLSSVGFIEKLCLSLFFVKKQNGGYKDLPQDNEEGIDSIFNRHKTVPDFEMPLIEETVVAASLKDDISEIETQTKEIKNKTSHIIKPDSSSPLKSSYALPPLTLLESAKQKTIGTNTKALILKKQKEQAAQLEETLASFNVTAKVMNITAGPSVTRYELQPGPGVKISKITALAKDIALKLAATDIRMEAPIPGKSLVGIEVPNSDIDMVSLATIFERSNFSENKIKLSCAVGLTITGDSILMDLSKMPHILIAGATGSGKSICINALIISILLKNSPDTVRFLMIDPKKVELSLYDGIPHLLAPVVTNPNKAAATLHKWAIQEMEKRYEEFAKIGVKNIEGYNSRVCEIEQLNSLDKVKALKRLNEFVQQDEPITEEAFFVPKKIPYIVVVIDELADLMMVASQEVESTICRLAQMSRATGIHLVIATQRPSVNVITGLIKANIPSRISFFLQSQIDSRTIIDMPGAEKLLGKGDMLYSPVGSFKPKRLQGVFVSEKEVKNIVDFWKKQETPTYISELVDIEPIKEKETTTKSDDAQDELYEEAKQIIINTKYASTSYLQRKLRIGYNRAARLMDELEQNGIISEYAGEKKPRQIIS